MIIKAADEEIDLDVAHIDSEYKIGYDLTKELLSKQECDSDRRTKRHDCIWRAGRAPRGEDQGAVRGVGDGM